MGLNIGVEVRKQVEGYMCEGRNPQLPLPELEEEFFRFLGERFPDSGVGRGGVCLRRDRRHGEEWFDFDVRLTRYGAHCDEAAVYLAIVEFAFQHFSHVDGIEMRTYWSG